MKKINTLQKINIVSIQMVKEKSLPYGTKKVESPREAAAIAAEFLAGADREHFIVFCLDTKNNVNAINTVSVGSLNTLLVHPREVFKPAILSNSCSIILCHNHPSGNPDPSKEDIEVTARLVEAGKILGIEVIDHVVIGDDGRYTSFKGRGIFPKDED